MHIKKIERNTDARLAEYLMDTLSEIENLGGMEQFALVALINDGRIFTAMSEGDNYNRMLGSIEHLKLQYFKENNK